MSSLKVAYHQFSSNISETPNLYQLLKLRGSEIKNGLCFRAGGPLSAAVLLRLPKEKTLTGLLTVTLVGEEESIIRGVKHIHRFFSTASPKVIRDWTKKSQTLKKGTYRLPFTIDLPKDLPCTTSSVKSSVKQHYGTGYSSEAAANYNQCWIRYTLEVNYDNETNKKDQPSLKSTRYAGILSLPPLDSRSNSDILDAAPSWLQISKVKPPPPSSPELLFGATLDSNVYNIGERIQVSFACRASHDPRIQIHKFELKVIEYCGWRSDASKPIAKGNQMDRLLFVGTMVPHDRKEQRASLKENNGGVTLTQDAKDYWRDQMQKQLTTGGGVVHSLDHDGFGKGGSALGSGAVVGGHGLGQYYHSVKLPVSAIGVARLYHDGPLIQVWHCVEITMTYSFVKTKNKQVHEYKLASIPFKVAHPGGGSKRNEVS